MSLRRQVWAPLPGYTHESDVAEKGFEFSAGVSFRRLEKWVTEDEALKHFGWAQRMRSREHSAFALTTEYEVPEPEGAHRERAITQENPSERANELMHLACVALWLVKPAGLGFELAIHFDRSGDSTSQRMIYSSYCPRCHEFDKDSILDLEDFRRADGLLTAICNLEPDRTVWTAMTLLRKSMFEYMWVARFSLQWIAMEGLFGPSDPREITYRLSHRVGFFLAHAKDEIDPLVKSVKDSYHWRSRVVHGLHSAWSAEEAPHITHKLEQLVRRSLVKVLEEPGLVDTLNGNGREAYMDRLMYEWIAREA